MTANALDRPALLAARSARILSLDALIACIALPCRPPPRRIGAGTAIELSPTVFSLQKSNAANYSIYGAANEAAHAQVVIGHEIGHLLVWAAEKETGVNWSSVYAQQVRRNWAKLDPTAPMEEAVTNLKVSGMGYFFSLNQDKPETDPQTRAEIDAWTANFLAALRRMK